MTATAKREEQRSLPWLQLCVYDSRRGKAEGDEADKILAYYPPDVSTNEQASTVGLAQAVSAFAAIFSQVQLHIDITCISLLVPACLSIANCGTEALESSDAAHALHACRTCHARRCTQSAACGWRTSPSRPYGCCWWHSAPG